jgi:hypothetical protein
MLFIAVWPMQKPLRGIIVAAIFGGLIGLGLFFVFRGDPTLRNEDAPKPN